MKVCFDDLPQDSAGLLALENDFELENPLLLDLYAFEDASININFKGAESGEIHLSKLQIITYNFNIIHFISNGYKVVVDKLEITCPSIHLVADGLSIGQCQIFTTRPQVWLENFQAEALKAKCVVDVDEEQVRKLLLGVTVIPGCGEHILNADRGTFNSLDKLKQDLPNAGWISPVIAWFANSLSVKKCQIKPGVDRNYWYPTDFHSWKVGKYTKDGIANNTPMVINQVGGKSIYGGTINDTSVTDYLAYARGLGFKIIFYPLIMLNQNDKPWRGRIGRDEEVTFEDVQRFYKQEYEPFILHYAELVAGKVDAFIIGSELIGLTSLKTEGNQFPFVKALIKLAGEAKYLLETPKSGVKKEVKVSYAADWSEYHSVRGGLRPLDELWMDDNIDFVGIDAYFPLTNSQESRFSPEEISKGCVSGEGYDFYFDGNHKVEFKKSEPWNQWKNLHNWWYNDHWVGNDKTPWQPKKKPIWFTEFGFPSIDKAPNKPNVFYNPECSDGGVPTFSNGKTDYAVQRLALRAFLEYWQKSEFIENMICWTWDARGEEWMNCSYYADGPLWKYGHWIDGKIGAPREEVVIKGNNIYVKQLVVGASKVKFDQANIIVRDIAALSGNSLTISDSRISAKQLFASFKGDIKITPNIWEKYTETKRDSDKIVITTGISYVTNQIIEAEEALMIVGGSLIIDHATLKIKNLFIKASDINSTATITANYRKEKYTGKKDWRGKNRSHEKDEVIQTAHLIQIISDTLRIDIDNLFKAAGTRVIASELDMEAKDYHFSGLSLHHSVTISGKKKGGILTDGKRYGSNHSHQNIEGVEVLVGGRAYVISEDKIWLQASQINADEVTIKAKQIELDVLVGTNFHNMWIKKHNLFLALTCGGGQLSLGFESKYTETSTDVLEQHLAPSAIIGRTSVDIEIDELSQISSFIQGSKGTIKAKKWVAKAIKLIRLVESDTLEVSVGLKLGVQENITGTIKTIKHTVSNLDKGGDFAGINTLSNAYASVRDVLGILAGGITSTCPWISASVSPSYYEHTDTTYAVSEAMFDDLQVESDDIEGALEIKGKADIDAKSMHLHKPENRTHEEMGSMGFSLSDKGCAANHYQEKNGRGFGFGVNVSWDRDGLFGDEFNIKYKKDKENFLDVSYAHPNFEKLCEADFSLQNLPSRCISNVNQTLRSVFETVGLEYQPIIFDTIKQEPKDEPVQDDFSTLEQDLAAVAQLSDVLAEALSDDTSDPFDLVNLDEFLDIPEQDKPIDLDELQRALDLSQQVQDILNIKSSDEESKADPLQKQLSESQPAQDQKTDSQKDAKGLSLKDVADVLIWAKKTYGDLAEKYPNATYIVETTVKGAPIAIAICASGTVVIPAMMAATALKIGVDAVIGDQIDKIQQQFKNKLSQHLQENEGLTPEQSAAIIGGTLLAAQALRQGMNVANAAKYIKATKHLKDSSKGKVEVLFKHEGGDSKNKDFTKPLDHTNKDKVKFEKTEAIPPTSKIKKPAKDQEVFRHLNHEDAQEANHIRNKTIHTDVKDRTKRGDLKFDHDKDRLKQYRQHFKATKKDYDKYQDHLKDIKGPEDFDQIKIRGNPQKTGDGHAETCWAEALKEAQDPNTKQVFLNQGMRKGAGDRSLDKNFRPDVTSVKKDDTIHAKEIMSPSDTRWELEERAEIYMKQLPKARRGEAEIKDIDKTLKKK